MTLKNFVAFVYQNCCTYLDDCKTEVDGIFLKQKSGLFC